MELFSKRYNARNLSRSFYISRPRYPSTVAREENVSFITDSLRLRLQCEIKYIINSNNYLEQFLITHNEETETYHLRESVLVDLSSRELGYDLTDVVNFIELTFGQPKYEDIKLFDLLELIIIFSKKEKREDLLGRISEIFSEEGNRFGIHESMVIKTNETGLTSIIPLIKEKLLKQKLEEFYKSRTADYEYLARCSADILQLIFSSNSGKSDTKKYSEALCDKIAKKWSSAKNKTALAGLLNEAVKNAKNFNNQIANIRHTDRHTIPIDSPNLYKLISSNNISIIELIILSLPEDFIAKHNPEQIKEQYFKKYKLKESKGFKGWVIKKKIDFEDEINIDDIPF